MEGTKLYDYMMVKDGRTSVADALADTDDIIARVRKHDGIATIVCECTFFARFAPRIRKLTNLPVHYAVLNVADLAAAVG
ncbi:hypothetical protein [Phyllobacterium zundukense]|uniref:Uncharacterized protein n=1 Tax=Phyllobacterium zundukense TaxID=1867719 RepID=A0ACD4CVN7_9HYPH|nr:hypothetical protein [Phyllobacterium zundukense]UXN57641.1 hypothetical protein N8E88_02165 [Phyllobacterium zundukense]